MEKIIKIIVSGLLSLGGIGATVATVQEVNNKKPVEITVTPDSSQNQQDKTQIQNITLEEAKTTALQKVNGTIIAQSEDDDDYEFKIQKDGYIYDIDVNKQTGKIDDVDKEKVKQTNVTLEQAKAVALKKVNGTIIAQSEDDDDYEFKIQKDGYIYDIDVNKQTGKIDDIDKEKVKTTKLSFEDAKKLALSKVNGKIVSSETDDDDYKFDIVKDNYLYEIEVDREKGKITEIDKEIIKSSQTVISREKAKSIALQQVNGTVKEIDYDNDDQEYNVEIVKGHDEYEIEIDALTGKVIKVEKED